MTDENWKRGVLDEDYFSDEELRDAYVNPHKHVIIQKDRRTFSIHNEDNLDEKDESRINEKNIRDEALTELYQDFMSHIRDNSLPFLSEMKIKHMDFFIN